MGSHTSTEFRTTYKEDMDQRQAVVKMTTDFLDLQKVEKFFTI
jgi:hypothetical protein